MAIDINPRMIDQVGIVVPTLGDREDFLVDSLLSISKAGCNNIVLVGPINKLSQMSSIKGLYTKIVDDAGHGLPAAINTGVDSFSKEIKYVGWLGDDDLLTKNSLEESLKIFASKANVVATYGACRYIDDSGQEIFLNKSGQWASKLMVLLPNLIPQPGSIYIRTAFVTVGGVKSTYPLSFDYELFFNLRKLGKLHYIPNVQGCFRWHANSMSVEQRNFAVLQTSRIRKSNLARPLRLISFLWEPVIILETKIIGNLAQIKSNIKK